MLKKPIEDSRQAKHQSVRSEARTYKPEEFDADTDEERPVTILAERRRQFLSLLNAQEPEAEHD